jgi:hypothetical protein
MDHASHFVTQRQADILRHATSWPKCYRNYFVTGEGSDDYADCEALVEAGLMERRQRDWVPDNIYVVTQAGKKILEVAG